MRPVVASSTTPNGASTTGTDHIRLRGVAPTPSFVPSNLSTADVQHSSDIRVGRHRAKLDEIRASLKAYEHESGPSSPANHVLNGSQTTPSSSSVSHSDITNDNTEMMNSSSSTAATTTVSSGVVSHLSSFRTEGGPKMRIAPMPQRHLMMETGNEVVYRTGKEMIRNGNVPSATPVVEESIRIHPSGYRYDMPTPAYHMNNNAPQYSPGYSRPPPPAYDAPPMNTRMTPVAADNYRTHLHIKTQPAPKVQTNQIIFQHTKNMAPPPPGKSTISIETINEERKTDNFQRLYHTSMDKKTASSVVSINVASPHTTKVNVGDSPLPSKSFIIGPRYTTDMDRSKNFVNYKDELRPDPRLVPSTSDANHEDFRPILFKPSNLDITFKSRPQAPPPQYNQPSEPPPKRVSSPIDRSLLDPYLKNTRRVQPCKPNMLRFYMEQHVERLLQQYREREKRMRQLQKEMAAAQLPDMMRDKMLGILQQKESRYTRLRRQKMSKNNFIVISHIGVGAFGKVSLVRKKDTDKVYAMKSLEKADVIMKQQAAHVKAERDILAEADSPWILTDFGLCTGLRWTHDRRYYGPENEHQRVDSFSLPPEVGASPQSAKLLNVRQQTRRKTAHSLVGTGNYMAPEVIAKTGHTQSCDWWSTGVILYEMVFGRVPFHDDAPGGTQYRIKNWRKYLDLSYGVNLSTECIMMVQQLICDSSTRLGTRGGASQVKQHPWFKGIDWENLRKLRADYIYIPRVAHDEDTSNFETFQDNDRTDKPNVRGLHNPAFYEFTYRHFFDTDSVGCPSLRPARRRSLRPLLENGIFDESVSEEDSSSHI
ncbi:hypothetical protein L3Y34_015410 [Caenorhabditis briggsae]|uniref:non-specific serine/threonine protein kinase n=1 Tax=Caenorhabditis briggsae TaxID=6238 RepID=A0AAE9DWE8_CAEBR|nr:hypothetical protein L3Y34_015410 [Caenorhabditis briggsae]